MEVYYNKDVSITKLVKHDKEKYCEILKKHKNPKTFLGFIIKEGYDYYISEYGYIEYSTVEECFKNGYNNHFFLDGNVIFKKPNVEIELSNGDSYTKYFDSDIDLDMYINSLQVKLNKLV